MKWIAIVLLAASSVAHSDVYVAIPEDSGQALYFPGVDTVLCYSVTAGNRLESIATDRCWPTAVTTIVVGGSLLMMNRPIPQLLKSCEWLNCELRAMPD